MSARTEPTSFVWPPPPEDLDDVALLRFPSEVVAEPVTGAGALTRQPPPGLAGAASAKPSPEAGVAAPAHARFGLEDFPRAGRPREPLESAVEPRRESLPEAGPQGFGTTRWVVALAAVLSFAALIGAPSIIDVSREGPLPGVNAPTAPAIAEPYRPLPIDEVERQALPPSPTGR